MWSPLSLWKFFKKRQKNLSYFLEGFAVVEDGIGSKKKGCRYKGRKERPAWDKTKPRACYFTVHTLPRFSLPLWQHHSQERNSQSNRDLSFPHPGHLLFIILDGKGGWKLKAQYRLKSHESDSAYEKNKTPYSWGSTVLKCFCFSNSETGRRNKKLVMILQVTHLKESSFSPLFLVCSVTLTLWWGERDFVICKSPIRLSVSVSFVKVFATSQVANKCVCVSLYLFTNTY